MVTKFFYEKEPCMKITHLIFGIALFFTVAGQGKTAEPLSPLTIQLNWLPNIQFAGILLAKESGWYTEAGIDLTIQGWREDLTPIKEVASGKAQIGVSEGAEFIKARAEGMPLKAIAAQFQKSPFCLISKKARHLETPAQLISQKIGIPDSETLLMLKIILAAQGIKEDAVTPVKIGWGVQPLVDDQIDVLAGYLSDEVLSLKALGQEVTYLPAFKYGYDFYSNVYLVTEDSLQQQPELIGRFLEVTLRGWQEAIKNPDMIAKQMIAQYQPDSSLQHQREALKVYHTLATLGEGKKFLGWMEPAVWQKGIDILANFGQIERKIPAKDLFTMQFLEAIYFKKYKSVLK
jgi:NitT/TauT family transport system substrate-binding protein